MLGLLLLLGAAASRPDVLLITIDTLRADHVGAYGYAAAQTPALDRLAREGVLLEEAVAQVPQTRPSHASLFTGRYPFEHGIRDNISAPLPSKIPTLATLLGRAGYETAAFIGAYPVARPSGLDQGFDTFDDPFSDPPHPTLSPKGKRVHTEPRSERRASEVVDHALAWLAKPRDKPFFLWVHLYDPHAPYEPPSPYRQRFARRPYDGEVAYADAEVSRLLAWLDRSRRRANTLVVATSDHGEGLGDHGESEHMLLGYDSTLRVPMLISWPGRLPAGARIAGQFRSVDLLPSLLELLALPAASTSGVSRAADLRSGARIPEGESYAESLYGSLHFGYAPLRALRGHGWKYIDAPRAELYRVADDAGETKNLLAAQGQVAGGMRARLRGYEAAVTRPTPSPDAPADAAEKLAALGYLGGGFFAGTPSGADPKDHLAELEANERQPRARRSRPRGCSIRWPPASTSTWPTCIAAPGTSRARAPRPKRLCGSSPVQPTLTWPWASCSARSAASPTRRRSSAPPSARSPITRTLFSTSAPSSSAPAAGPRPFRCSSGSCGRPRAIPGPRHRSRSPVARRHRRRWQRPRGGTASRCGSSACAIAAAPRRPSVERPRARTSPRWPSSCRRILPRRTAGISHSSVPPTWPSRCGRRRLLSRPVRSARFWRRLTAT